jgi:hypothetical protein
MSGPFVNPNTLKEKNNFRVKNGTYIEQFYDSNNSHVSSTDSLE